MSSCVMLVDHDTLTPCATTSGVGPRVLIGNVPPASGSFSLNSTYGKPLYG